MAPPLQGIRVLDWTIWQQGPQATAMLGELGAEVLKIETRGTGDGGRRMMDIIQNPDDLPPWNYYFEYLNRNKKGLSLDLKKPQGREVMYRLVEKSDVLVQNFRKGVPERLGLDYPNVRPHNPRIIYATASGYGPKGPDSGEPSFDYLGLARSGIMTVVGDPGQPPSVIRGGVADQMGAIMLSYAVLAALVARERLGVGQEVSTSHLGSMMMLQGLSVAAMLAIGKEIPFRPRREASNPLWNHYRCGDGKWLCLGMIEADRYWAYLCRAMGIEDLEKDPRFENATIRKEYSAEIVAVLDERFASRPRDEWLKELKASGDIICAAVNTIHDVLRDPQVAANDYVLEYPHPNHGAIRSMGFPYSFSETPPEIQRPAPKLNEHRDEILMDIAGYSREEVDELARLEVI